MAMSEHDARIWADWINHRTEPRMVYHSPAPTPTAAPAHFLSRHVIQQTRQYNASAGMSGIDRSHIIPLDTKYQFR